MIRTIKTIDYPAWISLALLIVLGHYSEQNHFFFTEYPTGRLVFYAFVVIALSLLAGKVRNGLPRIADWTFAVVVAVYLYRQWPHTFFDDAGFIMRYLDQLHKGYWFQYNAGEGAVFGISGFIHGLFTSLLVKFGGMHPERALHVSNLTGLTLSVYFLVNIFRYFIPRAGWAYAGAFTVMCFTKNWDVVLFTGMETPLHVCLVLGAFYFLLYAKTKSFYLFAALAVISKLDAVPVMAVLLLFHAIERLRKDKLKTVWATEARPMLLYFWLPLGIWVAFATWLFGSPFPQSAKAKMLYHSGADHSFFPFLEGFSHNLYKAPVLVIFLALLLIHLLYIRKKGVTVITRYFGFGWMYVGIMALYYFYNPNERMLWYYALPDLLLVAQCILSTLWLASEAKDWKAFTLPAAVIVFWLAYLKPDVDNGRIWMFSYLEKVERERHEIGKYIAAQATADDKLLAWHGLIARPFPGYVLDGTGLNSQKAVEFKLDRDSMLAHVKPTYGVHHGYAHINASFASQGYSVKEMFGDVTIENWPAWIWWVRNENMPPHEIVNLTHGMVVEGKITYTENPLKVEGPHVTFSFPVSSGEGTFRFILEGRGPEAKRVKAKLWANGVLLQERDLELPAYGDPQVPSLYTVGAGIPYGAQDSSTVLRVEFFPTGADTVVKINNPMVEHYPLIKSLH